MPNRKRASAQRRATGGGGATLGALTMSLVSGTGRRPVQWNTTTDETIYAGYIYRLEVAADAAFTVIEQDISHDITGDEPTTLVFDLSGDGYSEPNLGTHYYRSWIERDDGAYSPKSDAMEVVIYDFVPTAFSFTDETGLPLSTLETSNSITVLGVSAGAVCEWSVTGSGFEAQVNGTGSWATSGTCELNDTIQLRGTTSGSYETSLNGVLDIEGVTDTWSIETEAPPAAVSVTHRSTQNRGYGFGNTPATAWDAFAIADGDKVVLHVYAQENVGSLSAVTANGGAITFTQIGTTASDGNKRVSAWYADTSGVTSITPAFTVGSSVYGMSFAAFSVTGAGTGTADANALSAGYVGGPETIDMDGGLAAATDGALILTAAYEYNAAPPFTWAGATEVNETDADTAALSSAVQTTAANATINGAGHPSVPGPGFGSLGKIATQWDPA